MWLGENDGCAGKVIVDEGNTMNLKALKIFTQLLDS